MNEPSYRTWTFRTYQEAHALATMVHDSVKEKRCFLGLLELMFNAIEHGNLGYNSLEKQGILRDGRWTHAVQERLSTSPYAERLASLSLHDGLPYFRADIQDEGEGFDWRPYLQDRFSTAVCGRGIMLARRVSFDRLLYHPPGNHVTCYIGEKTNAISPHDEKDR